jgi:lycopene cyclase domain-containing protein
MKFLYLILNIASFIIPFIFSFHPKIQFHKEWKKFIIGTLLMMFIFITWDMYFTKIGVWGFNTNYISGIYAANLPLEEWLFFICIPYACIFTHHSITKNLPQLKLNLVTTKIITYALLLLSSVVCYLHLDKYYTAFNYGYATLLLGIAVFRGIHLLQRFYITFSILLVPFTIINGVLTGSCIDNEVVWYNNNHNLSIRIGTIPIEDTMYAFTMLLTILLIMSFFKIEEKQL